MDADPAGNSILFNLLLLLFFTLLNAFFAGAEMAVVSVNKNRIRSMADEGNKKAKVIEGLFEDSTKFLSRREQMFISSILAVSRTLLLQRAVSVFIKPES